MEGTTEVGDGATDSWVPQVSDKGGAEERGHDDAAARLGRCGGAGKLGRGDGLGQSGRGKGGNGPGRGEKADGPDERNEISFLFNSFSFSFKAISKPYLKAI